VNAYAAKQSHGAFQIVGQPYGTAPYGIAVAKGAGYSGLAQALKTALGDLQTSGAYGRIMQKWGVQSGSVSTFSIDGASS
ncbi:MAG: ABC transporter substrate-binding protein, partial [Acidimicrobiales bacterium]